MGEKLTGGSVRLLVAVALVLTLTGCTSLATRTRATERATMATLQVRTDLEPISKRFPALGEITQAHWHGSVPGRDSGGVPGPTDVHIQALVTLSADSRAATAARYTWQPAPADWETALSNELRPYAPTDAAWQASDEFTAEVCGHRYHGLAVFDPASGTVFLDVIGR